MSDSPLFLAVSRGSVAKVKAALAGGADPNAPDDRNQVALCHAAEAGHARPALSINSHGFVAETSQQAADDSFPPFAAMMNRIGRERGWPPLARQDFEASRTLRGANFIGSPQEVVEKILFQHEIFEHDRFLVQFTVGTIDHAKVMRSIELFGTAVAPIVRAS